MWSPGTTTAGRSRRECFRCRVGRGSARPTITASRRRWASKTRPTLLLVEHLAEVERLRLQLGRRAGPVLQVQLPPGRLEHHRLERELPLVDGIQLLEHVGHTEL